MDEYKVSEAIYAESLINQDFRISDDIYEESVSLSEEKLRQELASSFSLSGRYWVWKLGAAIYQSRMKRMFAANEMHMHAKDFKYFLSYPDVASLQMAYLEKYGIHKVGKSVDQTKPAAYYAFSRHLRRGDVVLVVGPKARLLFWGQVKSEYMYRPTRASGRHYRVVSWNHIDIPFGLTNKSDYLYQLPKEDVIGLKEILVGQLVTVENMLPFGFVADTMEMSIPFEAESPSLPPEKRQLPSQNLVLSQIIGALLRIVQ